MLNYSKIEIQGHRGCRGLMPENTIPSFLHAIDLGVETIELDVVISADKQVVVSHEAFFNHHITTLPNGDTITQADEKKHNLFQMKYDSIKKYDVGLKAFARFPLQKKMATYKPTLLETIEKCEAHVNQKKGKAIWYNIEIKTHKNDSIAFQPNDDEFVKLVVEIIQKTKIQDRCNIQSFDHDILKVSQALFPSIKKAVLVEDTLSPQIHIQKIGYKPYAYSPYYKLVNENLVSFCNQQNIKLIPWTVNEANEVEALMKLGVNSIITDYPDMAIEVRESLSLQNKR